MTVPSDKQSLSVLSKDPFNAETPPHLSAITHLTPIKDFFVRSHFPVPGISPKNYQLVVRTKSKDKSIKKDVLTLSLDLVKKSFTKTTVTATLQCAGNRRGELKPTSTIDQQNELQFGIGAIGTAAWTGVPVNQVLKAAGITVPWHPAEIGVPDGRFVVFKGADRVDPRSPTLQGKNIHEVPHSFAVSLPIEVAMRPEVLLAYDMNGEPLPAVHGGPLRLIVPGCIGDRSVKWITSITVQCCPSKNYYMRKAYKMFPPGVTDQTAEWDSNESPNSGFLLMECNVNSAITNPLPNSDLIINDPSIQNPQQISPIRGWAFSGGGRSITRVDVSLDNGQTWFIATLEKTNEPFAWRLWELPITPKIFDSLKEGPTCVICRAMDSACNVQPPDASQLLNFKGYMNNSWHRIPVKITKVARDATT